uniref:XRCC1_N domain-containing protein n=1 Tax=Macrostomum lignano TaxID=282301 RepID=A0A1I8J671_9PLAT
MAMRFVVIFSCDLEVVEVPFEQIRLQGRFATFDSHNDWIGFAQSDDHETERIRCSAIYGDAFYEATVILVSLDDGYDLTRVIQYCRRCRLEKDFRPKRMFLQVSPRVICPGVKKRLLLKPVQRLMSVPGSQQHPRAIHMELLWYLSRVWRRLNYYPCRTELHLQQQPLLRRICIVRCG